MTRYTPESPDNKTIQELRDELEDLNQTIKKFNKSSEFFTIVLVVVAMLQLMVATLQLGRSDFSDLWKGLVFWLLTASALILGIKILGGKRRK